MRKILILFFNLFFVCHNLCSQVNDSAFFDFPLDIPVFLSGNFGELRPNHFHGGIDIKTQKTIGKPVYSIDNGYISRIRIQGRGYGKSLYIIHPNGYTTVYGHLDHYNPLLDSVIKACQYEANSYEVDIFPSKHDFPVSKCELIAYSGNSGASGGPHIHFELRKTRQQIPVNALKHGCILNDTLPPSFISLVTYTMKENSSIGNNNEIRTEYSAKKISDSLYIIEDTILNSSNYIGFASEIYDFVNGSNNRCGVYSMKLTIDSVMQFAFTIDEIPFNMTRFINAHMDFELKSTKGKSVHHLFKYPNNPLAIYDNSDNNGIYHLNDTGIHLAEIHAWDANNNVSILKFAFARDSVLSIYNTSPNDHVDLVRWNKGIHYTINNTDITIPPGALYRDVYFTCHQIKGKTVFEDTLYIHETSEPLQKNMIIQLTIDSINPLLSEKLVLTRLDAKNRKASEGGSLNDNKLVVSTKNFGKFILLADTIAPKIKPIHFKKNKLYKSNDVISFAITDELSGIKSCNASINGSWTLFEYDPKNNLIFYSIDPAKLEKNKTQLLKIMITDYCNNVTFFESQFSFE